MNHRSVAIWSSLAIFLCAALLLVYLGARTPLRPELSWDARFVASPDNYGVRFRNEKAVQPPVAPLPPMAVRELTPAEILKTFGSVIEQDSGFEITGLQSRSRVRTLPGEPEPAVDCTSPILFSDGSEARLKVIVGVDDGIDGSTGSRFVWAMTPDGKPLTKNDAIALGWPEICGGSWPTQPQEVYCVFAVKGAVNVRSCHIAEANSGHGHESGWSAWRSGESTYTVGVDVRAWEAGTKELCFISYNGVGKPVELPSRIGCQSEVQGMPVRHLGAFVAFTNGSSSERMSGGTTHVRFGGHDMSRVHFVQFADAENADAYHVSSVKGSELHPMRTYGNLFTYVHSLKSPADFIRIAKFSSVRRIRMRLPDFPESLVVPAGADPLDLKIPAHWREGEVLLGDLLCSVAKLSHCYELTDTPYFSNPFSRKISEFPGKNTAREILVEVLAADLRAGAVVEIDRAKRTLVVKEPEPGWLERMTTWCRMTARRLGF